MGSLERRLGRLEAERRRGEAQLLEEALRYLSDEDLDVLEDALETGQEDGTATFEDLYSVVGERSRRALENLFDALEAVGEGKEPRASPRVGQEYIDQKPRGRDGYRIWKYKT